MDWKKIVYELSPRALPIVLDAFAQADSVFLNFDLNTPLRHSHFLAQALHESGGFTRLEENLNYSAEGLLRVFPKYFPDADTAKKYAYKPEAIANRVYGQRMGNSRVGEGWKYHGRGLFQLTGKANYEAIGRISELPLVAQPELATSQRYMLPVALHFWNSRNISALADRDDFIAVTKAINGGTIGLEDRARWLAKVKEELGV